MARTSNLDGVPMAIRLKTSDEWATLPIGRTAME